MGWSKNWSHKGAGPQPLGHPPLLSHAHYQGAGSEVEQPELLYVPLCDLGISDVGFTLYAAVLAHNLCFAFSFQIVQVYLTYELEYLYKLKLGLLKKSKN